MNVDLDPAVEAQLHIVEADDGVPVAELVAQAIELFVWLGADDRRRLAAHALELALDSDRLDVTLVGRSIRRARRWRRDDCIEAAIDVDAETAKMLVGPTPS